MTNIGLKLKALRKEMDIHRNEKYNLFILNSIINI